MLKCDCNCHEWIWFTHFFGHKKQCRPRMKMISRVESWWIESERGREVNLMLIRCISMARYAGCHLPNSHMHHTWLYCWCENDSKNYKSPVCPHTEVRWWVVVVTGEKMITIQEGRLQRGRGQGRGGETSGTGKGLKLTSIQGIQLLNVVMMMMPRWRRDDATWKSERREGTRGEERRWGLVIWRWN